MRFRLVMIILFVVGWSMAIDAQTNVDTTQARQVGEVVVTGINHATSRNLLPYSVSVIDGHQIEATGKSQLLAAISGEVPSLFVSQRNMFGFGVSSGGSGAIRIRGVGGSPTNAILMMVDGQPQFAGLFSHPVADFYASDHVDHVEVLRGSASVLYGSNAMGGVINVITKDADKDGVHTTLSSQYGSHNTWVSNLSNTVKYGKFSSLVSLGYNRTDGLRRNFDFKQSNLYAKVKYDFSAHWNASADYTLMNFVGNDPIYPRLANEESTDIYHQNVTRGEASLAVVNKYGSTSGAIRTYYSYGNHYIDDPSHFHSLDDRFGVLAYQNFKPWTMAVATVGFDYATYTGKIPMSGGMPYQPGSMATLSRKSITEYSPYVTLQQGLLRGALTLNGGLRMANSDKFGTHWVPQFGVTAVPAKGWTLKGSLSKGYRNPSFRELYLYLPANPDLDPERMMTYELGLGKRFSRLLTIDLTGYFTKGSDMIQVVMVDNGNGGVNRMNVNTGSFINKGVELTARSEVTDNLSLRASYSYMHTNLDDLTAAPKNQYLVGANWRAFKRLSLDAELKGVGGLFVDKTMNHQNYALLNMRLTYTPWDCLDVFAVADNITDTRYTINYGYRMPGITLMGGFKLRL